MTEGLLGPLNFSETCLVNEKCCGSILKQLYPSSIDVPCLFCNKKSFKFYTEKQDYLTHLYLEHRLIIGDEDEVAIFHEYLIHWREIFAGNDAKIDEYCTKMVMDQLPDGKPSKNEKYFLLCDVTPQDNELRMRLQKKRLELVLMQYQFERTDKTFERSCLFCRDTIKSTRSLFIEHLFSKHFMQLGKPNNLVFIDDLIDTVQQKLDSLICLFCEKKFKDRPTLKEHMRKKGHKRINPDNKNYDRFFLIHYQKVPNNILHRKKSHKNVEKYQEKVIRESTVFECDSDSNWSDWEDQEEFVTCLFCDEKDNSFSKLKDHIKLEHGIDFDKQTEKMTFYERVKVVNFVRRKMYGMECITCNEKFENISRLHKHLKENNHFSLGHQSDWNLPEFFFPTYEDDAFLCRLDDANIDDDNCITVLETDEVKVYSEDTNVAINLDAEALSKEQFKN